MRCALLRQPTSGSSALEQHPEVPLQSVSSQVYIHGHVASVHLHQNFLNDSDQPCDVAYRFPVPALAAVNTFVMHRGDGHKVTGTCKEKEEARKAFEAAMHEGKTSGFGGEQTKDLFNIQLGNIHAREKISVHISYAVELPADSARHTVRFHLPINVIPRYGTPPGGAQSSPSPSSPLDLSVDVVQPSPIRSITCPSSHPIQIKLEQPVEHVHGLLHRAKITLGPSADISKDVILVTEADELDKPSCLLQSPTATGVSGQVALGLTLVPNFKLQDYSSGTDFIFVVDRSGSMGQGSMALAKNALQISLRSLPTRNTSFNIVSFGSTADSLWQSSKAYSQDSLEEAARHVDSMTANYGGTEIAAALRLACAARNTKKPSCIFLLTDGAAYDIAGVETVIKEAVQSSPTSAPLRTFSLGIGSGTSTELLESISIAGQGATLYVQEGENMSGKVNRLVKAARSPAVVDVQLSWPGMPAVQDEDEGFEVVDKPVGQEPQGPISLYTDSESDSQSESGPPSLPAVNPVIRSYEQCPSRLPPLLPGIRFGCYALIDAQRLSTFPQTLSVTGKVASSGETVSLDVPVTILPQETDSQHQSLHTIAAQRLILSLEKGTYDLPASIASQSELICQAHLKALAVHYGQTYNLTSKHTSFVAVDERGTKTVTRPVRSSRSNASSCFGAAPMLMRTMAVQSQPAAMPSDGGPRGPRSVRTAMPMAPAPVSAESHTQSAGDEDSTGDAVARVARLQHFDGHFEMISQLLKIIEVEQSELPALSAMVALGDKTDEFATLLALRFLETIKDERSEAAEGLKEKAREYLEGQLGPTKYAQVLSAVQT